jgi:hypothetical protein
MKNVVKIKQEMKQEIEGDENRREARKFGPPSEANMVGLTSSRAGVLAWCNSRVYSTLQNSYF